MIDNNSTKEFLLPTKTHSQVVLLFVHEKLETKFKSLKKKISRVPYVTLGPTGVYSSRSPMGESAISSQ